MLARRLLVPAILMLTLGGAAPGRCQGGDLQQLLSGKTVPLTRKLKELTPEWRRASVAGLPEQGGNLTQMTGGILGAMFGGGMASALTPPPVCYTQGQTVSIGTETFLIVYQHAQKGMDVAAMMKAGPGGKLPPVEKLTPDSLLSLTLLNVRSLNSLSDLRAFNLDQELAESAKRAEVEAALRAEAEKGGGFPGFGGLGGGGGAVRTEITQPEPAPVATPVPQPKKPAPKRGR